MDCVSVDTVKNYIMNRIFRKNMRVRKAVAKINSSFENFKKILCLCCEPYRPCKLL